MDQFGEISCIDYINLFFWNLWFRISPYISSLLSIYIGFLYLQISKYKYAKILGILILFTTFGNILINNLIFAGCFDSLKNILKGLYIVEVAGLMRSIFLICFLLNLKKMLSKNCDAVEVMRRV